MVALYPLHFTKGSQQEVQGFRDYLFLVYIDVEHLDVGPGVWMFHRYAGADIDGASVRREVGPNDDVGTRRMHLGLAYFDNRYVLAKLFDFFHRFSLEPIVRTLRRGIVSLLCGSMIRPCAYSGSR